MLNLGNLRHCTRLGFILGFTDKSIIAFLDRKVNWSKKEKLRYFNLPEIYPFVSAETGYIPTLEEARRGLEQVKIEVNQRRLIKSLPFPTRGIGRVIPDEFNRRKNAVLFVDDETYLRWLSLIGKIKTTEFYPITEDEKWVNSIQVRK